MGIADSIRKLTTVWSFEVSGQDAIESLDKELDGLKKTTELVAGSIAAAAATIFGFAEATAHAASAIYKNAQQIGISTDAYQRLGFAAEHTGADAEDLGVTLGLLSRQAYAASQGNKESVMNFLRLGVSIRDARGQLVPANELLLRISDKFKAMPDGIQKTAMATEFFGRSGRTLLPMLNKGREALEAFGDEAQELGLVMSDADIATGRQFNRSLKDLEEIALSITYAVGRTLLPVLNQLLKSWKQMALANREAITKNLVSLTAALGMYLKIVWQFVTAIVGAGQGLIDMFGGFERVIPVVGVLAGIIAGGALLYGIGAVGTAIAGLGAGFVWFGTEALIAWVEATWPVILLGAAILGVLLIAEDIYTYFTGGDSVTGAIMNAFKEVFDYLEMKFDAMGTWAKVAATIILTPFRAVIETIKTLSAIMGMVMGNNTAGEAAQQFATGIASIMGVTPQGGFQGNTMSGALGLNPMASPSLAQPSFIPTMHAPVNAPVTVNVGSGDDPVALGKTVRDGVSAGINDAQLRQAGRTFQGPAATGGW